MAGPNENDQICWLMFCGPQLQVQLFGPAAHVASPADAASQYGHVVTNILVGEGPGGGGEEARNIECIGGPFDGARHPSPAEIMFPPSTWPFIGYVRPADPAHFTVYRWDGTSYQYDPATTASLRGE